MKLKIVDVRTGNPLKDGLWLQTARGHWLACIYSIESGALLGELGDEFLPRDAAYSIINTMVQRWNDQ